MTQEIPERISSTTIVLRKPKMEDIHQIFSASQYPGFTDGMLWEPSEEMEELKPMMEATLNAWKEGRGYSYSITSLENDLLIGRISIRKLSKENIWDIGFWTHPEYQSKGIMTEAVAAILNLGFTVLQAEAITAAYATWNRASKRVLEKNGFIFKTHLPQGFKKNNIWVAENVMEVRRDLGK